jgi:hypothetical protein
MTKKLIPILLFALQMLDVHAQVITVPFEFQSPKYTPHKSLYSRIDFLDSRADKSSIGSVAAGALANRDGLLVLKLPANPQIEEMLHKLLDSAAGEGELLLQLRRFKFVEASSARYCFLCATLYVKAADRYRKLMTIDTTFVFAKGEIKGRLTKAASACLAGFLTDELTMQPDDSVSYGLYDVTRMDSIEKSRLRLYSDTNFVDGLYKDYTAFSIQRPDLQCTVKANRKGEISAVYFIDSVGKKKEVRPRDVYAIVYKGIRYVATEYGYYPLEVLGDDLYFTGDVRIAAAEGDLLATQLATGLIGSILAKGGSRTTYRLLLDHISGEFVHVFIIHKLTNDVY